MPRLPLNRPHRLLAAIVVGTMAASVCAAAADAAPAPALKRTDLQRHDLSAPGREVVQVRVDFPPGAEAARHTHPGEEIVYILKGALEYRVQGKPPTTFKAGEVTFIPAGTVHAVKNVSGAAASELATYVVEKGKPLVIPAK